MKRAAIIITISILSLSILGCSAYKATKSPEDLKFTPIKKKKKNATNNMP